jgi:DNA-damage-inducible protein J
MQVQKEIEEKARKVLKNYGLTLEEGIELFLAEVAETGKLPLKVPNETTRRVMEEVMRGENVEETTIEELISEIRN